MFASVLVGQMFNQTLLVYSNFWLVDWGTEVTMDLIDGREMTLSRNLYYFHGYCGMQMAGIFFLTLSRIILSYFRTEASMTLHNNLLKRVLQFPVSFFDVTPVGRIINRFSQDMATIDEDLAQTLSQCISMSSSILGSVGAIAGSTNGAVLVLFVPM